MKQSKTIFGFTNLTEEEYLNLKKILESNGISVRVTQRGSEGINIQCENSFRTAILLSHTNTTRDQIAESAKSLFEDFKKY